MRDLFVIIMFVCLFLGSYGVVLMDLPIQWGIQMLSVIWVGVILCTVANWFAEKMIKARKEGEKHAG